jgi:hypothetical protein
MANVPKMTISSFLTACIYVMTQMRKKLRSQLVVNLEFAIVGYESLIASRICDLQAIIYEFNPDTSRQNLLKQPKFANKNVNSLRWSKQRIP